MTDPEKSFSRIHWLKEVTQGLGRWVTWFIRPRRPAAPPAQESPVVNQPDTPAAAPPPEEMPPARSVQRRRRTRTTPPRAGRRSHRSRSEDPAAETTADLAFTQMQAYMDAKHIRFSVREKQRVLDTGFRLPMGDFPAYAYVQAEPLIAAVYVHMPLVIPEPKRPAAAEAAVRANHGLVLGRFELSMRDGSLGFREAIPLADNGLSEKQFDEMLFSSLGFASRYYRAFARLVYADDLSPAEVIAEVEMAD